MFFHAQTFSVLLVSAGESFSRATMPLLPMSTYHPVVTAASAGEARRKLSTQKFDLVLINTPLPDEFGNNLALDIAQDGKVGVILFVKSDSYDTVARSAEQGILVLSKPTSPMLLKQALQIVCASQKRQQKLEQHFAAAEQELRLINRAKWFLMEQRSMSEPEAHHFIERQAMDLRISRKEVAQWVLEQKSCNQAEKKIHKSNLLCYTVGKYANRKGDSP